tara:strand:- start:7430 stop:9385 length:1956 start_codon:yes stop_codon:yes gene_type:complete
MQYPVFLKEIKRAILIRAVEEKLLELFKGGYLNGTVHTCVGQELVPVFITKYLNKSDHIVSNHRGHGHYLARFDDIEGLIGEIMGKDIGCSGGFGGSQHLVNDNFLSNGIQGGMVPLATGIGFFYKQKKIKAISIAYIGDGTMGEGVIYESFNIASKWKIPLLVVLENNGYAQSTSIKQSFSGDLQKRVEGFGLKYFSTSTNSLEKLNLEAKNSVEYVRKNSLPALIEIKTNRLNAHSKGDDNRSKKEIDLYHSEDIISQLLNQGIDSLDSYNKSINDKINLIVSNLIDSKSRLDIKKTNFLNLFSAKKGTSPDIKKHARYNKLINEALFKFLEYNDEGLIIGEDIETVNQFTPNLYGGAFKVTNNLSNKFPNRVLNTPISEAAIVGFCAGFSIKAGRSIVEIMFGDFSTLIFDQVLQHITKFEVMYNQKIKCPIVIRTPMGGKRGYGPTHSQSLEKYFIGIPNLCIIVLNHRISPLYIYENIWNIKNTPFLVVENKVLYTLDTKIKKLEGYDYIFSDDVFPALSIVHQFEEPHMTIICYGEVLYELELAVRELFIEEEIVVDIVVPSMIYPINNSEIEKSVKKTKVLVIIEEGSGIASWGSEVVAKLIDKNITLKKLKRFSNNEIIPSDLESELKLLPMKDTIKNLIYSL